MFVSLGGGGTTTIHPSSVGWWVYDGMTGSCGPYLGDEIFSYIWPCGDFFCCCFGFCINLWGARAITTHVGVPPPPPPGALWISWTFLYSLNFFVLLEHLISWNSSNWFPGLFWASWNFFSDFLEFNDYLAFFWATSWNILLGIFCGFGMSSRNFQRFPRIFLIDCLELFKWLSGTPWCPIYE